MSHTWFWFLPPMSRSQSGQRSKSCLSDNSKTTEANLTKLHRKIEHYEKVCWFLFPRSRSQSCQRSNCAWNCVAHKPGLEKLTNANRSSRFTSNRQFPWASRKLPIGHFRAHGNCRSAVSITIGRVLIYGKECVLTLNSITLCIFPSCILFLVIFCFKKKRYRILVTSDGK